MNHQPLAKAKILLPAFILSALILSLIHLNKSPPHAFFPRTTPRRSSPYSFDADASHRPAWMGSVPDDTPLSSLSIPGTHDTMTSRLSWIPHLWCQNLPLESQLRAGVRYLDIRLVLRNGELAVYHYPGDTGYLFPDVLRIMDSFLAAHPSETLVVRVKDEGHPLGDNDGTDFASAFARDIRTSDRVHAYDAGDPLPVLGHLRGSIFLLQEFEAGTRYGLEWNGTRMALEDWWVVPDPASLPIKWDKIRRALEQAATEKDELLYLAHVSATGVRLRPVDAAAGPKDGSATGLNDRTGRWLEDGCGGGRFARERVGVVILDFPGRRAVDAVLAWNEALRVPGRKGCELRTDV
ncbi:1-phosphatidylinositol phosphodiesterase [Ophiocordyceps camponoti-floridani]|uniref:1-phosphatidylinositol phosphodiesterase n=1 Tax=Ophiocordyceps camponoti-floridani TaxID=2030778 RepID=A0A8H4VBQ7_9HYPO|nr:1-phosphatidylinositol phosphodiesterase [Ophiocordyceps camponoti-floridani]